jgi:RNA polymerase sigma-70 factor (ECF subfamily)
MSNDAALEAGWCAQARAGDSAAFAQLVRLHQSAVRQQLRRLTHGDVALADDLAQECFIQAWSHLAQFQGQSRMATWLYRIAYNRFLMHLRSHQAMQALPEEGQEQLHGLATEHPALASAARLDVQAALTRLPEAERVAMLHCYQLDLSHEEAAQVLGLPLGTLKSQLLRAKARLRDALSAWAPEKAL